MFYCEWCKQFFDEPTRLTEYIHHSELDANDPPEKWVSETCPNCGDDHFIEAKKCPRCGDPHVQNGRLCEYCDLHLRNSFAKWVSDEAFYFPGEGTDTVKEIVGEEYL